jgi:hypothetical protein
VSALTDLNATIDKSLQGYLGTPKEERTSMTYNRLVDDLARAAIGYTEAFIAERKAARSQGVKR